MVKLILKSNQIIKNSIATLYNSFGEICEDCRGRGHGIKDRECSGCNGKGVI
mgnify:FL=1